MATSRKSQAKRGTFTALMLLVKGFWNKKNHISTACNKKVIKM